MGFGGCTKGEAWTRSPISAVQSVNVRDDFLADSRAIAHVDSSGSHVSGKGAAADLSRKKASQLSCASLNPLSIVALDLAWMASDVRG